MAPATLSLRRCCPVTVALRVPLQLRRLTTTTSRRVSRSLSSAPRVGGWASLVCRWVVRSRHASPSKRPTSASWCCSRRISHPPPTCGWRAQRRCSGGLPLPTFAAAVRPRCTTGTRMRRAVHMGRSRPEHSRRSPRPHRPDYVRCQIWTAADRSSSTPSRTTGFHVRLRRARSRKFGRPWSNTGSTAVAT